MYVFLKDLLNVFTDLVLTILLRSGSNISIPGSAAWLKGLGLSDQQRTVMASKPNWGETLVYTLVADESWSNIRVIKRLESYYRRWGDHQGLWAHVSSILGPTSILTSQGPIISNSIETEGKVFVRDNRGKRHLVHVLIRILDLNKLEVIDLCFLKDRVILDQKFVVRHPASENLIGQIKPHSERCRVDLESDLSPDLGLVFIDLNQVIVTTLRYVRNSLHNHDFYEYGSTPITPPQGVWDSPSKSTLDDVGIKLGIRHYQGARGYSDLRGGTRSIELSPVKPFEPVQATSTELDGPIIGVFDKGVLMKGLLRLTIHRWLTRFSRWKKYARLERIERLLLDNHLANRS